MPEIKGEKPFSCSLASGGPRRWGSITPSLSLGSQGASPPGAQHPSDSQF